MKTAGWIGFGTLAICSGFVGRESAAQTCPASLDTPEIAAANAALEQAPDRLDSRLALAAALMERGCYSDVVTVLEAGREFNPRASELQLLLRDARSMLAEQVYFDGLGEAEAAAKVRRNVLRCAQLGDIAACDAALESKPDDSQVLAAKGDALAAAGKLADALAAYTQAVEVAPGNAAATQKIAAVQARRADAAAACFGAQGAQDALRGCETALLPGAPDEFEIQKRRGLLFQQTGDSRRALDAYLAAGALRAADRATAAAVVALVETTGRADYVALVARGTALTTLDRPAEAIRVLRRARALAPELDAANAPLAAAEAQRRSESANCLRRPADQALAACRAALLQGTSDEFDVLARTAALIRDGGDIAGARSLLVRAAALRPNDAQVAAELARLGADGERVARADATPAAAASGSRRYSNLEPAGQAH